MTNLTKKIMLKPQLLVLPLVLLALNACTNLPPIKPYPYPIPENPDSSDGNNRTVSDNPDRQGDYPRDYPQPNSEPSISQTPPRPTPVNEPESRNQAVLTLVKQSEDFANQGEFTRAGSQLERALRIEPRNPWLVHRLANIRLEQGEASQAEAFAQKSIRLTELSAFDPYTKRKLKYLNWQLIADSRRQKGDRRGARDAEDRIQDYVI